MRVESFAYLVELEKTGSINAAAKNLFISQQGLSKAITSLERDMGVRLVEKSRFGTRFTKAGRIVLEHAKSISAEIEAMRQQLGQADEGDSKRLTELVVSPYVSITLLGRLMEHLQLLGSFATDEWSKAQIRNSLRNARRAKLFLYDWTTSSDATYPGDDRLEGLDEAVFQPLFVAKFGVMSQDLLPLAQSGELFIKQARCIRLASFNGHDYQQTLEEVLGPGCFANVTFKVSDRHALTSYVEQHADAGMLLDGFSFAARTPRPDKLKFTPLNDAPELAVGFAYLRDDPQAASYPAFIERFRTVLEKQMHRRTPYCRVIAASGDARS